MELSCTNIEASDFLLVYKNESAFGGINTPKQVPHTIYVGLFKELILTVKTTEKFFI